MKHTNSFLGFTLVELLAVIIIISILSGLGVGYYKRSVEQSRFSEGLAAASAVVEALNRTYFDEQLEGITPPDVHSFDTLDVEIGGKCTGGACQKTNHFDVYITQDNQNQEVVRAYRGGAGGGGYYIEMYPNHAVGNKKDQIACVGGGDDGVAFCQSMGYVHCDSSRCTK